MLREKGLSVRWVTTTSRRSPRPEAGSHHLQHGRGAEGQNPEDRVHGQQKPSCDGRAETAAEGKARNRAVPHDFIHFPTWFLSLIGGSRTYQEQKFDEDAEKSSPSTAIMATCARNVGVPELKEVADSTDKKTRWVELKVPITEGPRSNKVGQPSTWPATRL